MKGKGGQGKTKGGEGCYWGGGVKEQGKEKPTEDLEETTDQNTLS